MIEEVTPESPHYERVIELGNQNSKTLGFLPYAAIRDAATEGGVLAFVEGGVVSGYALFAKRVRTGNISLTHLCVDSESRNGGIARALVKEIVERNPNGAGIRLSCRKDYEANAMWPKLGFQELGEKPGRSQARLPLVVWWLPIAAQSLFDEPEDGDERMVVALDTNVILDIAEERAGFPESLALTAEWVAELAELVVTDQTRSELLSDTRRAPDSEFRTLLPRRVVWKEKLRILQEALPEENGSSSDLRIIAQSAASEASYFVTRDEGLLRHEDEIERVTGLAVANPADFLLRLHSLGGEPRYETRMVADSSMAVVSLDKTPSNAELGAFCHHHHGEKPADLRQRLNKAVANSGRIERLTKANGDPLALVAMYREEGQVVVTALRGIAGPLKYTAVRQMAHQLRSMVAVEGGARVVIDDQTATEVSQALRDEGFEPEGARWVAAVKLDVIKLNDRLPEELRQIGRDGLNAHLLRDYERRVWPSKVFANKVPSYVVPIRPEYARAILGYDEPQGQLFPLNSRASAARDNVYYMSPRGTIKAPSRILWWVSGGGAMGGVRALSWLDEVETGDPRRLHRKYRNRGVLDEDQVVGCAKPFGKEAHRASTALLFGQTEVFSKAIPISRARDLCESMASNGFFRTTREIDETDVLTFYEEGMRHRDET